MSPSPFSSLRPAAAGSFRFKRRGFTIIELLVATSILVVLVGLIASIYYQAANISIRASSRIDAFQGAREGFDRITRLLSQASLNTYWDYDDPNDPTSYIRKSELHFKCGPNLLGTSQAVVFQTYSGRTGDATAFGGMNDLLNAFGFFVAFTATSIPDSLDGVLPVSSRFRLMEWRQDTEDLSVYSGAPNAWFQNAAADALPIADNVIALIIRPRLPEMDTPPPDWADSYEYDSRTGGTPQPIKQHQLPPLVQVVLVSIDESSASRQGPNLETAVNTALDGLFLANSIPAETFDADIETLKGRLTAARLDYRIFSATVPLREAKWSKP